MLPIKILTVNAQSYLMQEVAKYGYHIIPSYYQRSRATMQNLTDLYNKATTEKPDYLYFLKDEQLTRPILEQIKKLSPNTKFIMWYGDQRGYKIPPLIEQRKGLLDVLLINNADPKQLRMYRDYNIQHVFPFYHAFSPNDFIMYEVKEEHDLVFGGNNFKRNKFPLSDFRFSLINKLQSNFDIVVYGNGWNFPTQKPVLYAAYAKVLQQSKISIGVNHYAVTRYYDRRLFECMAAGRMHLTHFVPGMDHDFKNHKHLVWFNTVEECVDLVKYYLKNSNAREKIAIAGRNVMLSKHTWTERAKTFVYILNCAG